MEQRQNGISAQVKKKALVFITGQYQLLQAIWYASEHPEYEFDALIKTVHLNESVKKNFQKNIVNCGMFSSVTPMKGVNKDAGAFQKAFLFIQMVLFWLVGRRSRLTQRIIREEIGDKQYDLVIADSENSILGGAFIDHADRDYRVVILQEGTSDIITRLDKPKHTFGDYINFMLARMGYCNPGLFYVLDKVRYCVKLSSFPDKLLYKPYAGIEEIFTYQGNDSYLEAIGKAFPNMDWGQLRSANTVLITSLMETLGGGENEYLAMKKWLKENTRGPLLLKRHPRDDHPYDWKELDVSYIDTGIPAELILANVTHQKVVFSYISTCIVDIIDGDIDYEIIRFDSLKNKQYNDGFDALVEQLGIPEARIIHLS